MKFLEKIFGNVNDKEIKKIEKMVDVIDSLEAGMQALSDEQLVAKTAEFKERIKNGETLDDLLPEAFAVVREASVRTIGLRHFGVQMIGGIVLHQGRIAEMRTGEGKTLVATLPTYLNALDGNGVHVITVNDYLAKRDKEWMSKIYNFLGLTVGCVINGVAGEERRQAYLADITYGTNNEFGFDYLRDNMVIHKFNMSQRGHNFAIVDEVDSILVDEARTPLIISGEGAKSTQLYNVADVFAKTLKNEDDYARDEKQKSIVLTDDGGTPKAESFFSIENLGDPENMEISHHINQALKARYMMKRDVDYVVRDGEILIVDEFTGRLMQGRRYSNGLHQAIEAKENLEVRKESQTLATITLQNYFRMYKKLAGMTGTAKTEEDEFSHIYNMDVVTIPTNKPIARTDFSDSVYKTNAGKHKCVIEDIIKRHETGQPVLVGTISIETSEYLGELLRRRGVRHEILNAKQHEREADIVSQAGRINSVTIATNMAGRGTDIVLGGNPDFMTKKDMFNNGFSEEILNKVTSKLTYDDPEVEDAKKIYNEILEKHKVVTDAEAEEVKAAGGLHIIGTERHESRRIDNQLRGRAGRQGDPGSSQFFISFEDDLMRLFLSEKVKTMFDKLGVEEDMPLEHNMLSNRIEMAQKKVEGRNFAVRKHVLQYDDVMNKQRTIIYNERSKVLHGEDIKENILAMFDSVVDNGILTYTGESDFSEEWDFAGLEDYLHQLYFERGLMEGFAESGITKKELKEKLMDMSIKSYNEKEAEFGEVKMRDLERFVLLKVVDSRWIDHIDAMDQFKQAVGMRAVGNEDPVRAYQMEGFDMFNEMTFNIQEDTLKYITHATIETKTEREQTVKITGESSASTDTTVKKQAKSESKVGRNDDCPCGSGKKYKKCCGREA